MTTTYTLTTSPLVTQGSQLRWHIDSPSHKEPLTLTHGRIVLQGWLLAQGETSPRLAIKTGTATYSFAFNAKRPDVVAAILQQPTDNHPGLCCGFNIAVPFSDRITLGLESDGLITWLEELTFSPTI